MFRTPRRAFTLIELLIVVAIIAILAAIAVPNFLEAQTRAKVARAASDMRAIATGIETFRLDHNRYPVGSDSATRVPQEVVDTVTAAAGGYDYYTFATRNVEWNGTLFSHVGEVIDGKLWPGLTTPTAYFTGVPLDPFTRGTLTFSYRESREGGSEQQWILTSLGPDNDLAFNHRAGGETEPTPVNPFSTPAEQAAFDAAIAEVNGRHGDISERSIESDSVGYLLTDLQDALVLISYDPTNGTISDGDLWRLGPGAGSSGQ